MDHIVVVMKANGQADRVEEEDARLSSVLTLPAGSLAAAAATTVSSGLSIGFMAANLPITLIYLE